MTNSNISSSAIGSLGTPFDVQPSPLLRRSGSSPGTGRISSSHSHATSSSRVYKSSTKHNYVSDIEVSTVQKQRKELQLMISELQDRDRELNEMVASHQKQLMAWEQDRQRVLTLEQKCTRLEGDLRNKNGQVKGLTTRLKVLESQDHSKTCALETTQKQLEQMSEKASNTSMTIQDLEDKNKDLYEAVQDFSGRIGQLEAKEEELTTVIKLKDKDLIEVSSHLNELTGKLKKLDAAYKQLRQSEGDAKQDVELWKGKYIEANAEKEKLKEQLREQMQLNEGQTTEMNNLKEECEAMKREIALTVERDKRKDQLLELQRSKQERTDSELTNLRQIYERQQRDVALLQLNLDSKQELLNQQSYSYRMSPHKDNTSSHSLSTSPSKSKPSPRLSNGKHTSPISSSLQSTPEKPNSSGDTDDLLSVHAELNGSPTSKLHRLLTESRQMVESLEQTTLPPYFPSRKSISPSRTESD
ncbi:coiled-coil domain-containing protein 62-like isoform X2 [Anneissia japonica]|nr:coiled-coil domain-containing protein 62-like isoform X2 [Anneissia japonica]